MLLRPLDLFVKAKLAVFVVDVNELLFGFKTVENDESGDIGELLKRTDILLEKRMLFYLRKVLFVF